MMKKHFVTFLSPGSIVSEQSEKPIDSWDVKQAMNMADKICERHNASPYAFYFTTRSRKNDELDSKVTKRSNTYHLGGTVKTLAQVKAENDPDNRILISNMECNGYKKIIVNDNSWRSTQPLKKDDVVLDYILPKRKGKKHAAIK